MCTCMLGKHRVMRTFNVWSRKFSAKMGVKSSMKLNEIEVIQFVHLLIYRFYRGTYKSIRN